MPAPRGFAWARTAAVAGVAAILAAAPAAASAGTAGAWTSPYGFDLPTAVATTGDGHGTAIAAWTTRDGLLRMAVRASRTAAWSAARAVGGAAYGPDVAIGAGRRAVVVWDAGGTVRAASWTPGTGWRPVRRLTTNGAHSTVAAAANGDLVAAWDANGDVHVRVFAAGRSAWGPDRVLLRGAGVGTADVAMIRDVAGHLVIANDGLARRIAGANVSPPMALPASGAVYGPRLDAVTIRIGQGATTAATWWSPDGRQDTSAAVIPTGAPTAAVVTATRAVVAWQTSAQTAQGLRQQIYTLEHDAAGWHAARRIFGRPAASGTGAVRLFADASGDIAALAALVDARPARCCFGRSTGNADLVAIMLPGGQDSWTAATTLGTSVFLDQFPPNPPFTSDEWQAGSTGNGFLVGFGQDGMRARDLAPQGLRRDSILGARAPNLGWLFRYELHPSELRGGTPAWTFGDGTPRAYGRAIQHRFTRAGTYTIHVAGRDGAGVRRVRTLVVTVAPAEDTTVANAFVRIAANGIARLDVTCAALTLACTGGVVRIYAGTTPIGTAALPPIDGGGIATVLMPITADARLRLAARGALAVRAHVDVSGIQDDDTGDAQLVLVKA